MLMGLAPQPTQMPFLGQIVPLLVLNFQEFGEIKDAKEQKEYLGNSIYEFVEAKYLK